MKRCVFTFLMIFMSYSLFADVDTTIGTIRLVVEDNTGSISMYRKVNDTSFVALFDSKTLTKNPMFFVSFGSDVYKLRSDAGFKLSSSVTGNTVTLACVLSGKVTVTVNFNVFSSVPGTPEDSIAVNVKATNIHDEPREIGIKAFFDTWLGESSLAHFSTAIKSSISSEYELVDLTTERWIQSSNDNLFVRLLFEDNQITQPERVVVANKSMLTQSVWNPGLVVGRSFHSLASYNNSALTVTWKKELLNTQEACEHRLCILTATAERNIPDMSLSDLLGVQQKNYGIPFDIGSIKNPADIARILEIVAIIHELQSNENYITEDEIIKLNAEVDEILARAGR